MVGQTAGAGWWAKQQTEAAADGPQPLAPLQPHAPQTNGTEEWHLARSSSTPHLATFFARLPYQRMTPFRPSLQHAVIALHTLPSGHPSSPAPGGTHRSVGLVRDDAEQLRLVLGAPLSFRVCSHAIHISNRQLLWCLCLQGNNHMGRGVGK